MRKILYLGYIDIKNLQRDTFLIGMLLYPLLIAIMIRYLVPYVHQWALETYFLDITDYYPLIAAFAVVVNPIMFGIVSGFPLLDERDEGVLMALKITPLPQEWYLVYRITTPMIVSIAYTFAIIPIIDLVSINPFYLIGSSILLGLEAPLLALFIGTFASNKVEGIAYLKGMGIVLLAPLLGYFIDSWWQYLFAVIPTYWPIKAVVESINNNPYAWFYIGVGIGLHILLLYLLQRRFKTRI